MRDEMAKVGAFEAKTRLAELLRETERGRSFVILRRGKAVAHLVPPRQEKHSLDLAGVLAAFHDIRDRVNGKVDIRELIEQGRRA